MNGKESVWALNLGGLYHKKKRYVKACACLFLEYRYTHPSFFKDLRTQEPRLLETNGHKPRFLRRDLCLCTEKRGLLLGS